MQIILPSIQNTGDLYRLILNTVEREGIAIAKADGVYKGHKPIQPPEPEKIMARWQRREITAAEAMRQMGMNKSAFNRKARNFAKTEINY